MPLRRRPDLRSARARAALLATATVAALLGVGAAGGILAGDDTDRIRELRAEVAALRDDVARAEHERNRLRIERDQLERRIAAADAPAVCPHEWVSTEDVRLLPWFAVDYPCGWHVVSQAGGGSAPEAAGVRTEVVLFSALPISLAPRPGPVADVEIVDRTDDPAVAGDALGPHPRRIAEERTRFARITRDEVVESRDGVTAHRIDGVIRTERDDAEAIVVLAELTDRAGVRHAIRVFAYAPSGRARAAVDRMTESLRVLDG